MTATVIDLTDRIQRAEARTLATIRLVRDYRGLRTDDKLGAASGIPRSKVQRLVTGETKMTIEVIAAFAIALGRFDLGSVETPACPNRACDVEHFRLAPGTNHQCPDFSSHEQNARDRLFPGATDDTLFNVTECDEIDREAEAEYQACEGHQ